MQLDEQKVLEFSLFFRQNFISKEGYKIEPNAQSSDRIMPATLAVLHDI